MHRRPPKSTRNDTLFPYTTRCRSTNGEERDQTSAPCQIANLWQVRLMNSDVSTIARRVRGQADALPDLFGRFDFDKAPERWAPEADAVSELGRVRSLDRSDYLDDPDLLARIREYTMLGDRTGDDHAAARKSTT